jgi:hypothetical protein
MKGQHFNLTLFIISTLVFLLLSIICFTASFTIDEGTGKGSFYAVICAKLYHFFKFPTITFFPNYFNKGLLFFGLGFNSLCYGFLIERVFGLFKTKSNEN